MIISRVVAYIFLAAATAVLATDVTTVVIDGELRLSALGEWWAWIHRDSLLLLQPAVERHISPALWDPWILTLLEWPAAVELGVLGGLFWGLSSWRRAKREPRSRAQK